MTITKTASGRPYSDNYLSQLADDLRQLAIDYERSGGTHNRAAKLLLAADTVRYILNANQEAHACV